MPDLHEFDTANLHDKMALLESALDVGQLDADDALKMLAAIHAELDALHGHDHQLYARYAALLERLEHQRPDLYGQVIRAYSQARPAPQTGTKQIYRAFLQPEAAAGEEPVENEVASEEQTEGEEQGEGGGGEEPAAEEEAIGLGETTEQAEFEGESQEPAGEAQEPGESESVSQETAQDADQGSSDGEAAEPGGGESDSGEAG